MTTVFFYFTRNKRTDEREQNYCLLFSFSFSRRHEDYKNEFRRKWK